MKYNKATLIVIGVLDLVCSMTDSVRRERQIKEIIIIYTGVFVFVINVGGKI